MKKLTTPDSVDSLISLTKEFHNKADLNTLSKIFKFCQTHFELENFKVLHKFLNKLKIKMIAQKEYSDLFYNFALAILTLTSSKRINDNMSSDFETESNACVGKLLGLSQQPKSPLELKKILDYQCWQAQQKTEHGGNWYKGILYVIRKNIEIIKTGEEKEIFHIPEFLAFFIGNLCIFLLHPETFKINVNENKFSIELANQKKFQKNKTLKSKHLIFVLNKIPSECDLGAINLLWSLLSPTIEYSKLGQNFKRTVSDDHVCWPIVQTLLKEKIIPVVLNYESKVIQTLIQNLKLPLIVIQMIYQYHNNKESLVLDLNIENNTASLFYRSPQSTSTDYQYSHSVLGTLLGIT